jgi:hypothetical protein
VKVSILTISRCHLENIPLKKRYNFCGMCSRTCVRGCIQKFPDWLPGARTANGTALCHNVQLYRYCVSQSGEFCRHNPLCCFSTCVYCCRCCCLFRYRLSPETFGYTFVFQTHTHIYIYRHEAEICIAGDHHVLNSMFKTNGLTKVYSMTITLRRQGGIRRFIRRLQRRSDVKYLQLGFKCVNAITCRFPHVTAPYCVSVTIITKINTFCMTISKCASAVSDGKCDALLNELVAVMVREMSIDSNIHIHTPDMLATLIYTILLQLLNLLMSQPGTSQYISKTIRH